MGLIDQAKKIFEEISQAEQFAYATMSIFFLD